MGTLTAIITVNMENGEVQTINRTISADSITDSDIAKAKKIILDAWVDYLYRETDLYRLVKNSSITIEEPRKLKGD